MNMKTFKLLHSTLCIILFSLSVFAFEDPGKPFVLKGTLSAFKPEAEVFISWISKGEKYRASTQIKDGKFEFKGVLMEESAMASLFMAVPDSEIDPDGGDFANLDGKYLLLVPGETLLSGTKRLETAVLSGGGPQDDFALLERLKKPTLVRASAVGLKLQLKDKPEGKSLTPDSITYLNKIGDSLMLDAIRIENKFIEQHPASIVSLELIRQRLSTDDERGGVLPEVLMNKLSMKLKYSPTGKEMLAKIAKVRTFAIGKPAYNFTIPDTSGAMVSLSSYKGKYVLVDFWASWCSPCRAENPNLLTAYNKFKHKNFDIVAVSIDENRKKWIDAIHEDKMPWKQLSDLKAMKGDAAIVYGIKSIPMNFLLDPSGIIVAKNIRGSELDKKLTEIFGDVK